MKLLIYCINNLHMYRTLYQAGMFKTALKKWLLPRARARELVQVEMLGGAVCPCVLARVKALPV